MKYYSQFLKKTFALILLFTLVSGQSVAQKNQPKKVILETDFCRDVDDVGALAILHALQNKGESKLLAVVINEVHPGGAPAVDAVNTWYGRCNIPIGVYKGILSMSDTSSYLDAVRKFPHNMETANAPGALKVYRRALKKQPDNSVTIISVGFLNNLYDLLISEPKLVARKVKELVIMAYYNNDGFNLVRHSLVEKSKYVIENWPSPLVISPIGETIFTGDVLKDAPQTNPVREAFYKFFNNSYKAHESWDELAVLYGVRGVGTTFSEITTGTGSLSNGYVWNMKPGFRSYLEQKISDAEFEKIINDLMIMPPVK